jgi:hypothetical protein
MVLAAWKVNWNWHPDAMRVVPAAYPR